MQRDRRVRIYDLHAWTGIATGLLLFMVCLTGSIALFHDELLSWEDPATRLTVPNHAAQIHPVLGTWLTNHTHGDALDFVFLSFPTHYEPYFEVHANIVDEQGKRDQISQRWHPETGDEIPHRGEGATRWLRSFHRDLMWPAELGGRRAGRALVGVTGVIMMLSILSGLITHRKFLREFFTLRKGRSARLQLKDIHNVLGLWSLPFSTMIAFTGAYLGLIAILLPITGLLIMKGDTEKLLAIAGDVQIEAAGVTRPMLSVDDMRLRPHPETGLLPNGLIIRHWGDENAVYNIRYPAPDTLESSHNIAISAVDGSPRDISPLLTPSFTNRVMGAIAPLHYGTYGNVALKWLYFALGLVLCAMIIFGLLVWVERRKTTAVGKRSDAYYERLRRFISGFSFGCVLASIAVLYVDKLYNGDEANRLWTIGVAYFISWGLVILYAWFGPTARRCAIQLGTVTAIGLLGIPLCSALATADWSLLTLQHYRTAQWTEVSFLLLGICAAVTTRLTLGRNSSD